MPGSTKAGKELARDSSLPSIFSKPGKEELILAGDKVIESESEDSYYDFSEHERTEKRSWRQYFNSEEIGQEYHKFTKEMNAEDVDSDSSDSSIESRKSQEVSKDVSAHQLPSIEGKQIIQPKNKIHKINIGLAHDSVEFARCCLHRKNPRSLAMSLCQSTKDSTSFPKRPVRPSIPKRCSDHTVSALHCAKSVSGSVDKKRVRMNKVTPESVVKAGDFSECQVKGCRIKLESYCGAQQLQRKETIKAININISNLNVNVFPAVQNHGLPVFHSTKNCGNESVIGFRSKQNESKKLKDFLKNYTKKHSEKESSRGKSGADSIYVEMKECPLLDLRIGRDCIVRQSMKVSKTIKNA